MIKMINKLKILDDCRELVKKVFILCNNNIDLKHTLNSQIIRSSISVGSNIAEGNERVGKDRNHFFSIALGSLEECRFQLSLYLEYNGECEELLNKIRGVVFKLKQSQSLSQSQSFSKGE